MRELIVEARRRVCHEGGAPHDAEPCERYDAIETDLQRLGL